MDKHGYQLPLLMEQIAQHDLVEIYGHGSSINSVEIADETNIFRIQVNEITSFLDPNFQINTKSIESQYCIEKRLDLREIFSPGSLTTSSAIIEFADLVATDLNIRVVLIGFDFSIRSRMENSVSIASKSNRIDIPEKAVLDALKIEFEENFYKKNNPKIIHIGFLSISLLTPEVYSKILKFNDSYRALATVDPYAIDSGYKFESHFDLQDALDLGSVLVVAEITTNHYGCLARLIAMIRLVVEQGCKVIKLQKRHIPFVYGADALSQPYQSPFGTTFNDYREGLEFGEAEFQLIDQVCARYQVKWFCSVLDVESFNFICNLGAKCIKVPSTVSENKDLLEKVERNFRHQLVISTGFTPSSYQDQIFERFGHLERVAVLHCISSYPAPLESLNLNVIKTLNKRAANDHTFVIGYSSHDMGSLGSQLAVASGARIIEKHVKLGETEWGHFDHVAVDLLSAGLSSFVSDINLIDKILGDGIKKVQSCENHKYKFDSGGE